MIGVGSVTSDLSHYYGSQVNESVFVTAPGKSIFSLWIAFGAQVYSAAGGAYTRLNGTSYAVPYAAAMGVLAKEIRPDIGLEAFCEVLKASALDLGDEGYDPSFGWGIPQADRLIQILQEGR